MAEKINKIKRTSHSDYYFPFSHISLHSYFLVSPKLCLPRAACLQWLLRASGEAFPPSPLSSCSALLKYHYFQQPSSITISGIIFSPCGAATMSTLPFPPRNITPIHSNQMGFQLWAAAWGPLFAPETRAGCKSQEFSFPKSSSQPMNWSKLEDKNTGIFAPQLG